MSLYASRSAIEKTIQLFTEMHQCATCGKWFTEMENFGSWTCLYHPGKYDHNEDKYTCCGESHNRTDNFHHRAYGHLMTFTSKDRFNHAPSVSPGCTRCDCQSRKKTLISDEKSIKVEDVASLIPYMENPINKRAGLKKNPLRLFRKEKRAYGIWEIPPSDR
jgi:hypothetical protein